MLATGAQIRMARAFLGWTAIDLAKRSGIGVSTVQRIETYDGIPNVRLPNLEAVVATIIDTGRVRFEGETCVCVSAEVEKTPGDQHE